ncbi:hypothetical protein CEXT_135361 [Caerostris extrusa]|uniref:Uncharacterized protein n=1 Tax=Caerostris extrusa TaxID=172846 RepID=A0AAV4UEA3_CAEEX|nr:hypothetical protein CEXT_135361 [Caerostris extrusa]
MYLPTPQLIDLKSWCPSSSDEVPSTCSDIWEISVPEESSLVWSIFGSGIIGNASLRLLQYFKKRKGLKILWKKLSGLFAGIHLRNVLSHGNVLLENISLHLDQDDLPLNLIEKMLELINDGPALAALSRVGRDTKPLDDEEFEHEMSKSEQSNLIQKCPRWKEYMFLLPL